MSLRSRAVVASRALTTAFFAGSSLYGILNFSPFAYQQFIRPRLLPWLVWCVSSYRGLFMGAFSIALLSLLGDVQRPSTKPIAMAYIVCWGTVAVALLVYPVIDWLGPNPGSLFFAGVALVPALWLSVIDHVACWRQVFGKDRPRITVLADAPIMAGSIAAGLYVWVVYGGLAILRQAQAGQTMVGFVTGATASLLLHLLVFTAAAWLYVTAAGAARLSLRGAGVQYGLALLISCGWMDVLLGGVLLPTLAVVGPASWIVATLFSVALTASWSGIALRLVAGDSNIDRQESAIDVFIRPALPVRSTAALRLWLVVLPGLALLLLVMSERMDWAFLVQKAGVLAIWFLAWSAMMALAREVKRPSFSLALACSIVILGCGGWARAAERRASVDIRFQRTTVLANYAAHDASFRTLDDALAERSDTPRSFYEFLRANTNVAPAIAIRPRQISLGRQIVTAQERPNIFLFVYDSLRPDYLAPYNSAVTFTPALSALANDSLVFRNAFTRYGGTGLSVPAIWSGTMLPHRQYVLPFAPMNTLLALLEGNDYRVMASFDSVIAQVMPPTPDVIALGGFQPRLRDDACSVMADLSTQLSRPGRRGPVFAYSLPQNTHVSYAEGQPIRGVEYPGFHSPLAARVRQIDSCLGAFVRALKAQGLFDSSIIIVTSDHGDAMGEGGRWGHGSAGFPEIYRIPLIIHLPTSMARQWTADLNAVSLSTDIVPTLYRLLDEDLTLQPSVVGTPLVFQLGTEPPAERRRGSFLLAGSYGPVYALLERNGERLYFVDAMNESDYAFNLSGGPPYAVPVPVTDAERRASQRVIKEQIEQISAFFAFNPDPLP